MIPLRVVTNHSGEGIFPTFKKGTKVECLAPCKEYPNWFSCKIDQYNTFVPIDFVENNCLLCDYNPTELIVKQGDEVVLLSIYYQWAIVQKENEIGWLPCHILTSMRHQNNNFAF